MTDETREAEFHRIGRRLSWCSGALFGLGLAIVTAAIRNPDFSMRLAQFVGAFLCGFLSLWFGYRAELRLSADAPK